MTEFSMDYKLTDWMSHLPASCVQTPLDQLAIPGSHDTFSYTVSPSGDVGPDGPSYIKTLVRLFGTVGKNVLYHWSVTQSLNVSQQLQHGIRYLDCRVCWSSKTNDFRFLHGLIGATVSACLDEVNVFLEKHPKEVVILDFNHFYSMSNTDHVNLLTLLTDKLGSKMYPYNEKVTVTLEKIWERNLQIICIYQNDIVKGNQTFWPGATIRSLWANTPNIDVLMSVLEKKYMSGRHNNGFYSWQGVVTPSTCTVFCNICSSLKDLLDTKLAPVFVSWLRNKKTGINGINVCTMDFVEEANYISNVIQLNYKSSQGVICYRGNQPPI
ncbi:PI-PLC X domain-containing protein 3-like [Argopecten irradians]|uniref:PI-PLC X domain-containing protein 3-like n=1 Tax=Argopecten irradians TaxID=31199 RepID=UPI00371F21FE